MPTEVGKLSARIRFDGEGATVSLRVHERTLLERILCRPRCALVTEVGCREGFALRVEPSGPAPGGRASVPSPVTVRHESTKRPSQRVRVRAAQVRVAADRRARVRTPKWIVELARTGVDDGD